MWQFFFEKILACDFRNLILIQMWSAKVSAYKYIYIWTSAYLPFVFYTSEQKMDKNSIGFKKFKEIIVLKLVYVCQYGIFDG